MFAVVIFCVSFATGQQKSDNDKNSQSSLAGTLARGFGKTTVIVVGSAAEATWVTTKFTANHVAKPVAKTIFVKAIPKLTIFAIKKSPIVAKKLAPTIMKLALL